MHRYTHNNFSPETNILSRWTRSLALTRFRCFGWSWGNGRTAAGGGKAGHDVAKLKSRERKEGILKDEDRVRDEGRKRKVVEGEEEKRVDCGVDASNIRRERIDGLRGRNEFSRSGGWGSGGHDGRDMLAGLLVQKDEEKGELSGHEKFNWAVKHPSPVRPNRSQALRVCSLEFIRPSRPSCLLQAFLLHPPLCTTSHSSVTGLFRISDASG